MGLNNVSFFNTTHREHRFVRPRIGGASCPDQDINLSDDIFVPPAGEVGLGALEAALDKAVRALPVETKLRDAVRAGKLERAPGYMLDEMGLKAGVISEEEYRWLQEADSARNEVIAVDAFSAETFKTLH